MWSTQTIVSLSRETAIKAAQKQVEPYVPASPEEVQAWTSFPFPNMGDYRPDGWYVVDTMLVDATGRDEYGPALSQSEFRTKVASLVKAIPDTGFGIVEVGPFQVVIAIFTQNPAYKDLQSIHGLSPADIESITDTCPECGTWYEVGESHCPKCKASFQIE